MPGGTRCRLRQRRRKELRIAQGRGKEEERTIKEKAAEAAAIPLDASCQMIFDAVIARLGYLIEVGLGYLSLDRPTRTLSGGEVERVNLTTCLGASLVNTLFVLDEPSIGLHPRDVGRSSRDAESPRQRQHAARREHEEAVMRAADHLIEIGPAAVNSAANSS
jgi:excinuclease ABC subunit A